MQFQSQCSLRTSNTSYSPPLSPSTLSRSSSSLFSPHPSNPFLNQNSRRTLVFPPIQYNPSPKTLINSYRLKNTFSSLISSAFDILQINDFETSFTFLKLPDLEKIAYRDILLRQCLRPDNTLYLTNNNYLVQHTTYAQQYLEIGYFLLNQFTPARIRYYRALISELEKSFGAGFVYTFRLHPLFVWVMRMTVKYSFRRYDGEEGEGEWKREGRGEYFLAYFLGVAFMKIVEGDGLGKANLVLLRYYGTEGFANDRQEVREDLFGLMKQVMDLVEKRTTGEGIVWQEEKEGEREREREMARRALERRTPRIVSKKEESLSTWYKSQRDSDSASKCTLSIRRTPCSYMNSKWTA